MIDTIIADGKVNEAAIASDLENEAELPMAYTGKAASVISTFSSKKSSGWDRFAQSIKLPAAVYFILGNEFCERFSFYGMKTILPPYLVTLGLTEDQSMIVIHAFIFFAYFVTLLGGLMADTWLGKFKTILWLSGVYCIGNIVLSVTSIPGIAGPWGMGIGLFLIACGTGGIKPCVSAFGGDQVVSKEAGDESRTTSQKATFFSFFYFSINAGSLLSMAITPLLKADVKCFGSDTCYPLAFGVPAVLMAVALVVFVLGLRWYVHRMPEGNIMNETLQVIIYAIRNKKQIEGTTNAVPGDAAGCSQKMYSQATESQDSAMNHSSTHLVAAKEEALDENEIRPSSFLDSARGKFSAGQVNEVYDFLRVTLLFVPTIFFWSLYDQQSSRWVFQGYTMNPTLTFDDGTSFRVLAEQMQLWNAILILVFIPLFNYGIYPMVERLARIKLTPLRKITSGMFLTVITFIMTALIQIRIDSSTLAMDPALEMQVCTGNCISILWQIPQYILITASEILVSVTLLSFAYDEAPPRMKSLISAFNLLTVAFGNLFTMIITAINPFGSLTAHTDVYNYLFYSAVCLLATLALLKMSFGYTYRCKAYRKF